MHKLLSFASLVCTNLQACLLLATINDGQLSAFQVSAMLMATINCGYHMSAPTWFHQYQWVSPTWSFRYLPTWSFRCGSDPPDPSGICPPDFRWVGAHLISEMNKYIVLYIVHCHLTLLSFFVTFFLKKVIIEVHCHLTLLSFFVTFFLKKVIIEVQKEKRK